MFMRVVATHSTVTATVNRYSHFFSFHVKSRLWGSARSPPKATPMHILYMIRPICTPRPRSGRGRPPPGPPEDVTHPFTPCRSVAISERKNNPARTPLPAATGPTNTHERVLCGYGYGPRVGTAAVDALGVRRARLVTSAGRAEGQTEGRRSRHIVRMRSKGAEFEARGLLRTFQRGPAAAQWAEAGGAPAPRLNDRSRPRPQGGSG